MLNKFFFAVSVALLITTGVVVYADYNQVWKTYEANYYIKYGIAAGGSDQIALQQMSPVGTVNNQERCVTCHVPDLLLIGGKLAATRLGPHHPSMITSAMVDRFGLPPELAGKPLDLTGCVVCHNGNGLGTEVELAHQNLIPNWFQVVQEGGQIYKLQCSGCHGINGEGKIGPPLNNPDRLGFFEDNYYFNCIWWGGLGILHHGSIMPPWGAKHGLTTQQVYTMVHWVRHYQKVLTFQAAGQ